MFLAREIPGNWICEGISCYRLVTEWQVLYGDVHKECSELGGRLAKIESEREMRVIAYIKDTLVQRNVEVPRPLYIGKEHLKGLQQAK